MVDVFVDSRAVSTAAINMVTRYTSSVRPNGVNVLAISAASGTLLKPSLPSLPAYIVSGKNPIVQTGSVYEVISQVATTAGFFDQLIRREEGEAAQVKKWLDWVEEKKFKLTDKELVEVDAHLLNKVYMVGPFISAADIVVAVGALNFLKSSNVTQLARFPCVVRWLNHVQNLPGLFVEKQRVSFDLEGVMEGVQDLVKKAKMEKKAKQASS